MDADREVKARMLAVYDELLRHDGFGSFTVALRILRRGQKEVIVDCGKQYRFVVDFNGSARGAQTPPCNTLPGDEGSRVIEEVPSQLVGLPGASARRGAGDAPTKTGD